MELTENMSGEMTKKKYVKRQKLSIHADKWVTKHIVEIDEEWMEGVHSLSELPETYEQAEFLYDSVSSLYDDVKGKWSQIFKISSVSGIVFCGPAGCGKTVTAYALVKELVNIGWTEYIELDRAALSIVSKKEAKEYIRAIFRYAERRFTNTGKRLMIIFNQIPKRKLRNWIMDVLLLNNSDILYTIFIEVTPEKLSADIKKQYPVFTFSLPDKQKRVDFFQHNLTGELKPELFLFDEYEKKDVFSSEYNKLRNTQYTIQLADLTLEQLAEKTEGFTYCQLKQLTDMMHLYLIRMLAQDREMDMISATNIMTSYNPYSIESYVVDDMILFVQWQNLSISKEDSYQYVATPVQNIVAQQIQQSQVQEKDMNKAKNKLPDAIVQAHNAVKNGKSGEIKIDRKEILDYILNMDTVAEYSAMEEIGNINPEYLNMVKTPEGLEEKI